MDVSLALLADYANVTADGKLNIMGIFQAVISPQFPLVHGQMNLIVTFEAHSVEAGTKKKLDISFRDADGKTAFTIGGEMEIPTPPVPSADPITINHILVLQGIRFEKAGDYQFVVQVNSEPKKEIPVRAIHRPQQ